MAHKLEAGLRLGRYLLRRPIGAGGNGQVFLAWQENATGKPLPCVVKMPLQRHVVDPEQCQFLLEEAGLAIRLGSHPNIVQVIDADVHEGMPFIVMEYVKGADLGQVLSHCRRSGRGLSLPCIYEIFAGAAEGLNHAHVEASEAGTPIQVIHRDIKPGNILITRDGGTKLGDFGLGRTLADGTSGNHMRGTARYMSPEHVKAVVCPEMDVYALGIVAWEMVENRRYRDEIEGTQHFQAILSGEIPRLENQAAPIELRELVMDCLAPHPRARPSASEILRMLRQCPGYVRGPDAVKQVMRQVLGEYRPSGTTGAVAAATPELAATLAAINAAAAARNASGSGTNKTRVAREIPAADTTTPTVVEGPPPMVGAEVDVPRPRPRARSVQSPPAQPSVTVRADRNPQSAPADEPTVVLPPPSGLVEPAVRSPEDVPLQGMHLPTEPEPDSTSEPRDRSASQVISENTMPIAEWPMGPPRSRSRRPLWLALTAGGVAAMGGLGVFASAYLGTSDQPSILADAEHAPPAARTPAAQPKREAPPSAIAVHVPTSADLFAVPPAEIAPAAEEPAEEPAGTEAPVTEPSVPVEVPPRAPEADPPAEPKARRPASKPKAKRTKPDKPLPPATAHVELFLLDGKVEVKIGRRMFMAHGKSRISVAAGRHAITWLHPTKGWRNAGTKRFASGTEYLVRLHSSGKTEFIRLGDKAGK